MSDQNSHTEIHLLMALESTKVCVWRWSASTGRIDYFPENAGKIIGLPQEHLPRSDGETLALIHPDDRAEVADAMRQANKDGSRYEIEYRLIGPNQNTLHVHETSQPEFDRTGQFVGNFGTWQNITDRRRAEENLRESEQRLSHAVQIAKLGYWSWDEVEDKLISCSEEFAKILGYSHPNDVIPLLSSLGEHIKWVHPDDRARYSEIVEEATGSDGSFDVEYRIMTPNGEIRYVREIAEPEFDSKGRLVRTRGTLQDVTERTYLENELHLRERELSQAQRLGKIGHWRLDLKKQEFTFWSDELYRIFGVDPKSFQPSLESFLAAIHEDDLQRSIENRETALAEKRPYSFEYRIVRPDGEVRIISGESRPEFDDGGNPLMIFGITQDVTEARQRETALRQAQKMEAIGQLTGGVAHDFNNLLAIIRGNAELLTDDVEAEDPKIRAILRASQRGAELTQRLLAFSRKQVLQPEVLDLNAVATGMTELLRRTLGEVVEVEIKCEDAIWTCEADPGQLENALLNLAINARDAMPEGGKLTIETANVFLDDDYVTAQAEVEAGQYAMLAVSDTGCGMTPETLAHAFEPFFTTKEVGKGSGLGLSMAFGFAKQSGGHMTIDSEIGVGTTVKLYLPCHFGELAVKPEKVPADDLDTARGEVILVVEDDADLRVLVVNLLGSLGYKVLEAGNAEAALANFGKTARVDLLLTDVVLPGGTSGNELAAVLRARDPDLAVLFMSGYTDDTTVHQGGFDEGTQLLQKPFRKAKLAQAVRAALS